MAIICWGNLAKSADDTERIEQSIQAYVEDHDENVNAHQVYGSSLYMHRVNEILDHLDGSVNLQKLPIDKIIVISSFESTDMWFYQGSFAHSLFNLYLIMGGAKNMAYLYTGDFTNSDSIKLDFSKNPAFQTSVAIPQDADQEVFIIAGIEPTEGARLKGLFPTISVDDSFGFKVVDDALYAYWTKSGVVHTQSIAGIDITNLNIYRAVYYSSTPKIEFYVNGVLKYTATANLPDTNNNFLFDYSIFNTVGNGDRDLHMADFWLQMDR